MAEVSGLTAAQIVAQIEAVLRDQPEARVIAINAAARYDWPADITYRQQRFALVWAESSLAIRAALAARPDDAGLVILTPLPATGLGADLLARFGRGKVHAPDRWQMVRDAFRARDVDPRLRCRGWMADLLLEGAPTAGYPPVPGGILDLDTVWRHLLRVALDLDADRPDVDSLLRWTVRGDGLSRFSALPDEARAAVRAHVATAGGGAAAAVMACIATGHGALALPIGLISRVLFDQSGAANPDLATARGRLELFTGGHAIEHAAGRSWADAAERVVGDLIATQGLAGGRRWLDRADQLAQEVRVGSYVAASTVLLSGFTARLQQVAVVLAVFLDDGSPANLAALEAAVAGVAAHAQARLQVARCERVAMALRLARWLALPEPAEPTTLSDAAHRHRSDGAFVDWARRTLTGGDELAALSDAYGVLSVRLRTRREREAERFAGLLRTWTAEPTPLDGMVPLEDILDRVAVPLAKAAPLLLLVLDGLSMAVFRELMPELLGQGWGALGPAADRRELAGLALLPTVTDVCRASLLAGRPMRGDQSAEKQAFAAHPGLAAACRNRRPPILFHKGEITEGGTGLLTAAVRAVVGTPDHRVVAVVYNAVDDQLGGAEQLHPRWTLDDLRLLPPLLYEARNAGRIVVLTADHGHIPEDGTTQVRSGESARWRRAEGAAEAGEVLVTGRRVLAPQGDRAILAWSDRLRYLGPRNGYHGGASPQEVVVPLAVLAPADDMAPGWVELPPIEPSWWEARPGEAPAASPPPPAGPKRRRGAASLVSDVINGAADDWIGRLLVSETYAVQRSLAGGRLPDDAQVRTALEALGERGGRWTRTALAQRLQIPAIRLGGLLAQLRRLLNVDGYQIVAVDDASGIITFDRTLLDAQFRLRA